MSKKNKAASRLAARYLDDKILLSATHAWTYMRLPLVPYEFMSYNSREGLCDQITMSLATLITNNQETVEAHLRVTYRPLDTFQWATRLNKRASLSKPTPGWSNYLGDMAEHVDNNLFDEKEVYLGVCLGERRKAKENKSSGVSSSALGEALAPLKDITKALESLAKYDDMVVSDTELEYWHDKAADVHRSLSRSSLKAIPATSSEVAWLIARPLWPDMDQPAPSVSQTEVWGAGEIVSLAEGIVTNQRRWVEVEQLDAIGKPQKGYSITLAISRFPDALYFPEQEPWIHFAAALPFSVDFSTRFSIVPALKVQKDVGKKLATAKDQAIHIAESGSSVPLKIQEQLNVASMLEYTIDKDRMPWAYARHRITVFGETSEEAVSRARSVIESYRDLGIDVSWPSGDQFDLLCESMPGDVVRSKAYYQRQELAVVAGGMPTASSQAGDRIEGKSGWIGPYLGRTTSRVVTPVFFSPHGAMARNNPPGVAIIGQPGGGKALALDTAIATPNGWTTMGDIKVGDKVFDEKGLACNVISVTETMNQHDCYEVVFDDGSTIIADGEHRWLTETRSSRTSIHAQNNPRKVLSRSAWATKESLDAMKNYLADLDPELLVSAYALPKLIPNGPSSMAYVGASKELFSSGISSIKVESSRGTTNLWPARDLVSLTLDRMSRIKSDQRDKINFPQVRTTREIMETLTTENGKRLNHSIPLSESLILEEKELILDPYCFGVWLADGTSIRGEIVTADKEISEAFELAGYPLSKRKTQNHGKAIAYGVLGGFQIGLRKIGVLGDKHIPTEYLRASKNQRLQLLKGLLDGDGHVGLDGNCELILTNLTLAKDAQELMHSLGIKTNWSEGRAILVLPDGSHKDCGPKYRIKFTPAENVFSLANKSNRLNDFQRSSTRRRYIKEVNLVESVPVRCITVDSPSHLYLAGKAMIPTHNSFLAFTLAYQMALQGVWTIYIDPKADAKPMGNLEGLGNPRVFDLREGNDGMLDPFSMGENIGESVVLAMETIKLLLGANFSEEREEALNEAVKTVAAQDSPSLTKVVDNLLASSSVAARNLGSILDTMRMLPFARLCFAPTSGIRLRPEDGLTIVTLLGLNLPAAGTKTEDLGVENRLAVSVMYLLTRYARQLMLSMDKSHPKAICIDEAWAITSTPQGAKLIPEVARMGRSHNTALILVSQNAGDLMAESVTNSLSTKFAFRSTIPGEIDDVMNLFGLELDQGYQGAVRDLRNGECLMQDVDGRVARVQVDAWNRELFDTFNTNPETRGKGQSASQKGSK